MSRIDTPSTIADSPEDSRSVLENVQKQLGSVPNLFRIIGNSPAALKGYVALNGALSSGELDAPTRERLAVAIANVNGCVYCNSAHHYLGKNVAKLSDEELAANQLGYSLDSKADVAVKFAVSVARNRGKVTAEQVQSVLEAGFSSAEAVEIVSHVALNTLTNYINEVFDTELDFPVTQLAEKETTVT